MSYYNYKNCPTMEEEKFYDENDAVKFIREQVGDDIAKKYDSDDIMLLIDTMFDYFDAHDDEDEDDINAIAAWVAKELRKDRDNNIEPEDVPAIVAAELAYEETLSL